MLLLLCLYSMHKMMLSYSEFLSLLNYIIICGNNLLTLVLNYLRRITSFCVDCGCIIEEGIYIADGCFDHVSQAD